jgi:hypothetical protein
MVADALLAETAEAVEIRTCEAVVPIIRASSLEDTFTMPLLCMSEI